MEQAKTFSSVLNASEKAVFILSPACPIVQKTVRDLEVGRTLEVHEFENAAQLIRAIESSQGCLVLFSVNNAESLERCQNVMNGIYRAIVGGKAKALIISAMPLTNDSFPFLSGTHLNFLDASAGVQVAALKSKILLWELEKESEVAEESVAADDPNEHPPLVSSEEIEGGVENFGLELERIQSDLMASLYGESVSSQSSPIPAVPVPMEIGEPMYNYESSTSEPEQPATLTELPTPPRTLMSIEMAAQPSEKIEESKVEVVFSKAEKLIRISPPIPLPLPLRKSSSFWQTSSPDIDRARALGILRLGKMTRSEECAILFECPREKFEMVQEWKGPNAVDFDVEATLERIPDWRDFKNDLCQFRVEERAICILRIEEDVDARAAVYLMLRRNWRYRQYNVDEMALIRSIGADLAQTADSNRPEMRSILLKSA